MDDFENNRTRQLRHYDTPLVSAIRREPEHCDDCGKVVGYYDPRLPEGEKIVITNPCYCWRTVEGKNVNRV